MNTILALANTDIFAANHAGLKGLLFSFLVMCVVLGIVALLLWLIETYIAKTPFPTPVRLVIALVCVILVLIWAFGAF